jgi:FixJ family two-component response regulator
VKPIHPVVFIVDDDPSLREALTDLFQSTGLAVKAFASADDFLKDPAPCGSACLLLDVRLPRASGFDVQRELAEREINIPIIFITGHGTIPMSVRAMKAGAVEFLTKPFVEEDLLEAVRSALSRDESALRSRSELAELKRRYASLTPREREVMIRVAAGQLNKQVAFELGRSEITVKVHRRHIMEKMQARTLADLVRFVEKLAIVSIKST